MEAKDVLHQEDVVVVHVVHQGNVATMFVALPQLMYVVQMRMGIIMCVVLQDVALTVHSAAQMPTHVINVLTREEVLPYVFVVQRTLMA